MTDYHSHPHTTYRHTQTHCVANISFTHTHAHTLTHTHTRARTHTHKHICHCKITEILFHFFCESARLALLCAVLERVLMKLGFMISKTVFVFVQDRWELNMMA